MNLVGTLAKVAMGVMVAKGVGKMLGGASGQQGGQQAGSSGGSAGGGLGGLLGGLAGAATQGGGSGGLGGLGGLLGSVLSGGGQGGGAAGGLGGLLNSLGGAGSAQGQGGGQSGGLGGLGDLLNQALGGQSVPEPSPQQNTEAEILLRAMINAAKSDGTVDESEQRKIVDHIGDVSQEEVDFIRNEMAQPLDINNFVRSVPDGMQAQVYVMSLLGIDLDSQAEAQHLDQLATALGINHEMSNQIHAKVGVPALYR